MNRLPNAHRELFDRLVRLAHEIETWDAVTGVAVEHDEGEPEAAGGLVMLPPAAPEGVTLTLHAKDHEALHVAWHRASAAINGGGIGFTANAGERGPTTMRMYVEPPRQETA